MKLSNEIKMIVVDLDNTLLLNNKTISKYTFDVLDKLMKKGIKLVYATARSSSADFLYSYGFFLH